MQHATGMLVEGVFLKSSLSAKVSEGGTGSGKCAYFSTLKSANAFHMKTQLITIGLDEADY